MSFQREFGSQDHQFQQEQQSELAVLDLFGRHRDELLSKIGTSNTLGQLSVLSQEVDAFMSEAERQANGLRFFSQRLWTSIQMAQSRFSEKFQLTRQRLSERQQSAAAYQQQKAHQQAVERHHEARLQQTLAETQEIYRQTAQSQREASDRAHQMWMRGQFPNQYCPCCGGHKLLAHTYCYSCYQGRI